MLAIAQQRAKREGLKNMEFKQVYIEENDLPLSFFDAVICRWGLMFLPNLCLALENVRKTLVPGGRLAIAVWAESKKVPQLNLPMAIVRRELELTSLPKGVPDPFSLSDLNELRNSLLQAGFRDVRIEKIQVKFDFDLAEDCVSFTKDTAAPVNMMLSRETEKRKQEIWKAVTDQVRHEHSNITNGHLRLNNEAICAVGRRQ